MNSLPRPRLLTGALAVFALTLFTYYLTFPRFITLEDAGLFQMICQQGGIGHPPGYPLFVLSCQAFAALPWFPSGVQAANLLSGIYAAAASAVLVLVVFELTRERQTAIIAGLAYAFSSTLWSQAIIVEVYSLAAFLFVLSYWLVLRFVGTQRAGYLFGFALTSGLALSNHWPLHVLSTLGVTAVVLGHWPLFREFLKKPVNIVVGLILVVIGLAPYLTLFQPSPAFAVYGGIESLERFFRYVSRSAYTDHYAVAGWEDRLQFQGWVLAQTLRESHPLLVPFLALGVYRTVRQWTAGLSMSLILIYLGGTTLLILLLGFEFNDYRMAVYRPYTVIAFMPAAVWLAIGLRWVMVYASEWSDSRYLRQGIVVASLAAIFVSNLAENNRRDDQVAYLWAQTVWRSIPENVDFFVKGDTGVGLLGYLHHVEGQRQDLTLYSWHSLVFSNRLARPGAGIAEADAARRAYLAKTNRSVFSIVRPDYPYIDRGIVFERSESNGFACHGDHQLIEVLLDLYLNRYDQLDGHERQLLFATLWAFATQHIGIVMFGENKHEALALLQKLQESLPGKLGTLGTMLRYRPDAEVKPFLTDMAVAARKQLPRHAPAQIRGLVEDYNGSVALLEPAQPEVALAHYERSMEYYDVEINPSHCRMVSLLRQLERSQEALAREKIHGACPQQ